MAEGPNPAGKSHASHAVPNLHRLPVKSTPKVKARPNSASTSKRSGPLAGGPGGTRAR